MTALATERIVVNKATQVVPTVDPTINQITALNGKLQRSVDGRKNVTLSITAPTVSTTVSLQVRYSPDGSTGSFVDLGAAITQAASFPVERTLSDANGMPLSAGVVEIEATIFTGAGAYEMIVAGGKRAGVGGA